MIIKRIRQKIFREEWECEKCHFGYMQYTGVSFNSSPSANQHKCSNKDCTNIENSYGKVFPRTVYEDK